LLAGGCLYSVEVFGCQGAVYLYLYYSEVYYLSIGNIYINLQTFQPIST
jgi:hypothetical protein